MLFDSLKQDLSHGLRLLWAAPSVSLIAIVSLALGIGASVSMFIVVNAALLRPVPVTEPTDLVLLFSGSPDRPYGSLSYPDYRDYRDQTDVFTGLTAYGEVSVSVSDEDSPERLRGLIATGNFFQVLGVEASLGRTFTPEDDERPGEHAVAVISDTLWRRSFGADPDVPGREIRVNGTPFTVLGVTPAGFLGPDIFESYDIYFPMMMQAHVRPPRANFSGEIDPDLLERRGASWLRCVGRLRKGVSIDEAEASSAAVSRRLEETYPDTHRDEVASLFPLTRIDPRAYPVLRGIAALLLSVASLVLLVAAANVANLLLARSMARRREIAVRLAIGGSRVRLIRQLLTESLVLASMGGGLGLLLAFWVQGLTRFVPRSGMFSFTLDLVIDSRVLLFTFLASLLSTVLVGLAPALSSSRYDIVGALRDSSSMGKFRASRLNGRNALVVAQVALSIVLLVRAGLFVESFRRASSIAPGFAVDEILTVPLDVDLLRYDRARGQSFYREAVERARSLPGVRVASVARVLPLQGGRTTRLDTSLAIDGDSAGAPYDDTVMMNIVGVDYFDTLGIPLLTGRDFSRADSERAVLVVITNESFASRYFPCGEVLGAHIRLGGDDEEILEVIGVAQDSTYRRLGEAPTPYLYVPVSQRHETGMELLIRTEGGRSPEQLTPEIRRVLLSLEPNLPVSDIRPLSSVVAGALFPSRMASRLMSGFAFLAAALSASGLYGVVSYAVSRRTREMGIRIALGARPIELIRLVVGQGLALASIGIVVGWALALAGTRLLDSFLYGVSATDPWVFLGVGVLLAVVLVVTTYVPARKASRSSPLAALRYE